MKQTISKYELEVFVRQELSETKCRELDVLFNRIRDNMAEMSIETDDALDDRLFNEVEAQLLKLSKQPRTSHTPGPWTVLYSSNTYPSIHAGPTQSPIASLYAHTLCRSERDVFENAEANARLIAAAPELLESLKFFSTIAIEADPYDRAALGALALIKRATGGTRE